MQFANAEMSWIMLALPLLALCSFNAFFTRRKRINKLIQDSVLLKLDSALRRRSRRSLLIDIISSLVIVLLLCLATLRPQWGFTWKESARKGVDLVVAIDVSTSMMARDISPNRLEIARREILDLLTKLKGDRIALVAFAGVAFIEAPLTLDYTAFKLFLSQLDPTLIPVRGTDLRAAIQKSIEAFGVISEKNRSSRERAIILITDGEHLEGSLDSIRQKLIDLGIGLYVMGIGTEEGAPIPLQGGYKKDRFGKMVITQLKPDFLADLAKKTGGIYVQSITSDEDTHMLYSKGIKSKLSGRELKGSKAKLWNEYFQIPLFLALILLIGRDFAKRYQVRKAPDSMKDSNIQKNASLALLFVFSLSYVFLFSHSALADESIGRKAREEFDKSHYENALRLYSKGKEKNPEDYRIFMGLGASEYRLKKYNDAIEAFSKASQYALNPIEKGRAFYNIANSYVQEGQYQQAIEFYKKGIELIPYDKRIKENFEYTQKLIKKPPQKKQNKNQDKQNKKNKEQNKDQQSKNEKKNQEKDKNQNKKEQNKDKQENDKQDKEEQKNNSKQQDSQDKDKQNHKKKQKEDINNKDKKEKEDKEKEKNKDQKSTQQSSSSEKDKEKKKKDASNKDNKERAEKKDKKEKNQKKQEPQPKKNQDKDKDKPNKKEQESSKPYSGKGQEEKEIPAEVSEQTEALLGSLSENKANLAAYRNLKAKEQLEKLGNHIPVKDW